MYIYTYIYSLSIYIYVYILKLLVLDNKEKAERSTSKLLGRSRVVVFLKFSLRAEINKDDISCIIIIYAYLLIYNNGIP